MLNHLSLRLSLCRPNRELQLLRVVRTLGSTAVKTDIFILVCLLIEEQTEQLWFFMSYRFDGVLNRLDDSV